MINLRYHIVSLVAVFLALALGVIAGTTVVDQGLVKNLRRLGNSLRDQQAELRARNVDLRRRTQLWDEYGDRILPGMMRGRLRAKRVVMIAGPGVERGLEDDIVTAVSQAGGTTQGIVEMSGRWSLTDATSRERLAVVLGSESGASQSALYGDAAAKLGERIAAPTDPRSGNDLIGALAREGFLTLRREPPGVFPRAGVLFVYVSAGGSGSAQIAVNLALPLVRSLAARARVAVAEPIGSVESLAGRVRDDGSLTTRVATVDHADTILGRLSLVEGLREIGAGRPAPAYGVRSDARDVAPNPTPSPSPSATAAA